MKSPPPPPATPCTCYVCRKGKRALFIVSSDINHPPTRSDNFKLCAYCLDDWRFALAATSQNLTTTTNRH